MEWGAVMHIGEDDYRIIRKIRKTIDAERLGCNVFTVLAGEAPRGFPMTAEIQGLVDRWSEGDTG